MTTTTTTDRTPKYYLIHTAPEATADPAPMTRAEAEATVDLVRRDRRGRMGLGRLHSVEAYQQRTPGAPWSVILRFKGDMYECGRTRRRLSRTFYVHHVRFTDGSDAKGRLRLSV